MLMTKLEIVPHPHPALRWKSREVTRIDAELRQMVEQMFDLMYASRGIGLAANQVALPYRLFVINPTGDREEKDQEMVFINPQITRRNGSEEDEEGCLSLPEIYGPVTRATRIIVDAFDLSGQQFEVDLEDLDARVVQHEYDHIEGVMFTDRVAQSFLPKLQPLIKDLELQFRNRQKEGTIPSDEELKAQLAALQKARTAG
jgi:peptide deformylase